MYIKRGWQQKGAVLPYVIIIFVIATIIAFIISNYFSTNLKQTVAQQKSMQAYYCTLVGFSVVEGAMFMDNYSLFNKLSDPAILPNKIMLRDWIPVPLDAPLDTSHGSCARIEIYSNVSKPDLATGINYNNDPGWIWVKVDGQYADGSGHLTTNFSSAYYKMGNPYQYEQQLIGIVYD